MSIARLKLIILVCCVALCSRGIAGTGTPYKILTNCRNIIVWQEFAPWLVITEDMADGRVCYYYNPVNKSKISLKEPLPGNWMPLGSAIKWLMYVDHYQNLDRLMAHDVDWHFYYIAWPSAQNQAGVGMVNTKCIFGQYRPDPVGDHYPVDLYHFNVQTGGCVPFLVSDSEKSQFAHDGNIIVYRAHIGPADNRIFGIYFSGGSEFEIAARNGIEPSVCGSLVAWAEASGGGYNILAKDISTGEMRTVAFTTANSPRPEAGRGCVCWQDRRNDNLDIYGYDWATGQEFAVTTAAGDQYGLRVCDDLVTYVSGATNYQTLWGASITQPIRITDLRANMITSNSVTLAWTSAGGTAYDVRKRTDGPITDANWSTAAVIANPPTPGASGQRDTLNATSLTQGHTYFALKVHLADGSWSPVSNCIKAFVCDDQDALNADEGSFVSFTGAVTGGSGSTVYCQRIEGVDAVRASLASGEGAPSVGESVILTGVLGQDASLCGPVITDAVISHLGAAAPMPQPVGMACKCLGGSDARFGGLEGTGPSNVWMLVRVWGRVSGLIEGAGCSFYINDGSSFTDSVYVTSPFAKPPGMANGSYVTIGGISRLSRTTGRQVEVIAANDIRIVD